MPGIVTLVRINQLHLSRSTIRIRDDTKAILPTLSKVDGGTTMHGIGTQTMQTNTTVRGIGEEIKRTALSALGKAETRSRRIGTLILHQFSR